MPEKFLWLFNHPRFTYRPDDPFPPGRDGFFGEVEAQNYAYLVGIPTNLLRILFKEKLNTEKQGVNR